MRHATMLLATTTAMLLSACSGSSTDGSGKAGSANVSVNGTTYKVGAVTMTIETGEDGWFRIDGEPVPNSERNAACCISLPMFPELTSEEVDYVIDRVLEWNRSAGAV